MLKADKNISIKNYNYHLAEERIAKYPLDHRDNSNLLFLDDNEIKSTKFKQIADLLHPADMLIFNNAKVIQARLAFKKETGAHIEIFCLEPHEPADYNLSFQSFESCEWKCMVGNLKKWKTGSLHKKLEFNNTLYALEAYKIKQEGASVVIKFSWKVLLGENNSLTFADILEFTGKTPLPPYLNREAEKLDKTRYQTVYAKQKGSVAAPTAGLHFTKNVFDKLKTKGIGRFELTLHVGAGTFRPVKSETIEGHEMHEEHFQVGKVFLKELLRKKGRVVAVGTTSVRTLESLYWLGIKALNSNGTDFDTKLGQWEAYLLQDDVSLNDSISALMYYMEKKNIETIEAITQIIISPGYSFKVIDGLITNFHQPQSTLLLLIASILGDKWKNIYNYALANEFRFLSYGDSSLFWVSE